MATNNAPSFWSKYGWDLTHGYIGPPIPADVNNYWNKYHDNNTNNAAPSGQQSAAQSAPKPSLHPTAFVLIGGGVAAIVLGGTKIGPLVNLSLVAVLVSQALKKG